MNFLKHSNRRILAVSLFCMTASYNLSAQEKTKKEFETKEELKEYIEYSRKLRTGLEELTNDAQSKSIQKKSSKNRNMLPRPRGLNPMTTTAVNGKEAGNKRSWNEYLQAKGRYISSKRKLNAPDTRKVYKERESLQSRSNNTKSSAERISGYGLQGNPYNRPAAINSSIFIEGSLVPLDLDPSMSVVENEVTDNSIISNAFPVPLTDDQNFVTLSSVQANFQKNGSLSGDLDLYLLQPTEELIDIRVRVSASNPAADLVILQFDENGELFNLKFGDSRGDGFSYFTTFTEAPVYIGIVDANANLFGIDILDPDFVLDPAPETEYELDFQLYDSSLEETDTFQLELKKGDVFGMAATNEQFSSYSLFKPDGELAIGLEGGTYFLFPNEASPLPIDGTTAFHYVVPEDGIFNLEFTGFGEYDVEINSLLPGVELFETEPQYIYLDFTGAEFSQRAFFKISEEETPIGVDPELDRVRTLSPISAFLTAWGFEDTEEDLVTLTSQIAEVVRENFISDLIASGINSNFDVRVISDYGIPRVGIRIPDAFEALGIPYSRVIVGGTAEESGINTFGIADNLDVGNYDLEDEALTLLGTLSAPEGTTEEFDGEEFDVPTLNNVEVADGSSKFALVATAIGNLITHEAGHYLGNAHSTAQNEVPAIMDEGGFGGNFSLAGLPIEGVFGVDEFDLDLIKDEYSFQEGASGLNETDVTTAFGLTSTVDFGAKGAIANITNDEFAALEAEALRELYAQLPSELYSYPSPVSVNEKSTIIVAPKASGIATITLHDVQGRAITEVFNGNLNEGIQTEISFDTSKLNLTPGVYIYKMNSIHGSSSFKFTLK